ncbi:DNA recombination/repair protein RecA, partial [Pseudomonas syringae]|nr:DNA recombination/repair protein RecA [Pseudomonas syringae]
ANSAKFLADNPEICKALEKQIRDKLLTPGVDTKAVGSREAVAADDMSEADVDI